MKLISNKKIFFLLIFIFSIFLFSKIVFAVWDGQPYEPGAVDNPECLPSEVNCDVLPAVTAETDPIFSASDAFTISGINISNWNSAYSWGDHSQAGYLTSYTENDPIFSASDAFDITNTDITNWDTAYSWGDHSQAGYETSLSFSSGLTRLVNTISNDLITGTTGVQTILGSLDGNGLIINAGRATQGGANEAGGDLTLKSGVSTGTGNSAIHFYTSNTGASGSTDNTPTEKMTILENGNVTIGSATTVYKLNVGGDIFANGGGVFTSASNKFTNTSYTESYFQPYIDAKIAGQRLLTLSTYSDSMGQGGTGDIVFTPLQVEKMRILANGNVGIGVINPAYPLEVNGLINGIYIGLGGTKLYSNVAIGTGALSPLTGNNHWNTAVGYDALGLINSGGGYNTAIGSSAGYYYTAFGYNRNATSSVYIGSGTMALANGGTNEIVIGASAVGNGSNSVTLGNTNITKTILQGNIGIGTTSPAYLLDVDGALNIKGENPIRLNGVWLMSWDIANTQMIIGSNYSGHGADVRFDVAGVPGAMLIQQTTGNLGIGTTSPTGNLHIKGTNTALNIEAGSSANYAVLQMMGGYAQRNEIDFGYATGSGYNKIVSYNPTHATRAYEMGFLTNSSERMTISTSGNVGIGTTAPTANLQVVGARSEDVNTGTAGSTFITKSAGGEQFAIRHRNASAGISGLGYVAQLLSQSANALEMYTSDAVPLVFGTSDTERVRIDSTGNVGIGTTNPGAKLDIAGSVVLNAGLTNLSSRPAIYSGRISGEINGYSNSDFSGSDGFLRLSAGGTNTKSYVDISGYSQIADMNQNIIFGTQGSEKMRISNNGNVGIGVVPKTWFAGRTALQIGGTGAIFTPTATGSTTDLHFMNNAYVSASGDYKRIINNEVSEIYQVDGNIDFRNAVDNIADSNISWLTRMRVGADGNVGIGTTAPSQMFSVNENFKVTSTGSVFIPNGQGLGINPYIGAANSNIYFNVGTVSIGGTTDFQHLNANFIVKNSGNVGIGTVTPTYKLELKGTATNDVISSDIGFNINKVVEPVQANFTGVASVGAGLEIGLYWYLVSYVTSIGETKATLINARVETTAGNQRVTLTLPISEDPRVTGRKIYRTKVGQFYGSDYLLTTISNNVDVNYIDSTPDASLTGAIQLSYWKFNSTSKQITINDTAAMFLDPGKTSLGFAANPSGTGGGNTTIGYYSGNYLTTGSDNTAVGTNAGQSIMTGTTNSFFGNAAGWGQREGSSNTGVGNFALGGHSGGNANVAIGYYAMGTPYGSSGGYNVALGAYSGTSHTTGTNNIWIGNYSGSRQTTESNQLIIDNLDRGTASAEKTSALIYGITNSTPASQILSLGGGGNVGIGTTNPVAKLDVNGAIKTNSYYYGAGYIASSGAADTNIFTRAGYGTNILQSDGVTSALYVKASGNIGIGTTNPQAPLHIYKAVSGGLGGEIVLDNLGNSYGESTAITFASGGPNPSRRARIQSTVENPSAFGTLEFYTGNGLGASFGERMRITGVGNVGIGTISPTTQLTQKSSTATESAPLGSEVTDSNNWTSTDWTGDYANGFTHTTGNTTPLSRTMTNIVGQYYQVSWTVTGYTAGYFGISLGGQSSISYAGSGTFGPKVISTNGALIFTPSSTFDGKISNISVKLITGPYAATYSILDSTNTSNLEIRSSLASLQNTFIGTNAGAYNTTGYQNFALGANALAKNTTGNTNFALGFGSLSSNTVGVQNSAIGYNSLVSNTSGVSNNAFGYATLYNNTSGGQNTAFGQGVLGKNTTGSGNVGIGYATLSSGTTAYGNTAIGSYNLTSATGNLNTAIGYSTGMNSVSISNQILLGSYAGKYETASNKLIIDSLDRSTEARGRSEALIYGITNATPASQILSLGGGGNVGIGTTTPVASLQISNTLNQQLWLQNSTGSDGSTSGIIFNDSSTAYAKAGIFFERINSTGYADGNLHFATSNTAGAEVVTKANARMTINSAGNVGIGTMGPNYKLDVSGYVNTNSGFLVNSYYGLNVASGLYTYNNHDVVFNPGTGYGSGASVIFKINDAEAARIISGGYMGIGVASPTAVLHLKAGTATANTAPLKFTSGTLNTTAEAGAIEYLSNQFYIRGTDGLSVNGNVGIGTTSPGTKLEIGSSDLGDGVAGPIITIGRNTNATNTGAGSINFLDKAGNSGYIWQDSAGYIRINTQAPSNVNDTAGTIVGDQTSIRETKQDINDYEDYESALSMIVNAPLHTFRYIKEVNGYGADSPLAKTRIGFIADEVDPMFMVGNSIDQVSVNGLLMASVKDLNLKLESLAIPIDEEIEKSFIERFYEKLVIWLGSSENGLEKICVKKSDGTSFCVNGDQLEQAVNGMNSIPTLTPSELPLTPEPIIVEPTLPIETQAVTEPATPIIEVTPTTIISDPIVSEQLTQ